MQRHVQSYIIFHRAQGYQRSICRLQRGIALLQAVYGLPYAAGIIAVKVKRCYAYNYFTG
jgi:hypothetical protein